MEKEKTPTFPVERRRFGRFHATVSLRVAMRYYLKPTVLLIRLGVPNQRVR